jgi:hypothetical protein
MNAMAADFLRAALQDERKEICQEHSQRDGSCC